MRIDYANIVDKELSKLGNPAQLMAYISHQIDLNTRLVYELAKDVKASGVVLNDTTERLIVHAEEITKVSSIRFEETLNPIELVKIPGLIEKKKQVNKLMDLYINALISSQSPPESIPVQVVPDAPVAQEETVPNQETPVEPIPADTLENKPEFQTP